MRRGLTAGAGATLSALAALAALAATGCGERGPDAIVLVVVDTLRPDRLSCYGYAGHETPHIDALATRGTRFEDAHAVASWTVPSMGAMLTSRYPMQLGLVEAPAPDDTLFAWRDRRAQRRLTPSKRSVMIAERLADAGYATAAFVDQPGLNVSDGFLQGFAEWHYPKTPETIVRHDTGAALPYRPWAPSLTAAYEIDGRLVDTFARWLAAHQDERVFAWVHLLTPHRPYNPVLAYAPRDDDPSARYDGEVRAADELVGRVVSAIDRTFGLDRTLLVFTSDHGEAFGEHGMEEHGHSLHGEVLRVPLVVAGSGFAPGAHVAGRVRTIDIAPTMLEAAGLEITDEMAGVPLGSWLTAGARSLPVYAEGMLYGSTERCLLSGDLKLMLDAQAPHVALYDVARDPRELENLASRRAADVDTLAARLEARRSRDAHDLDALGDEATEPESNAAREALRSLGYIR